MARELQARVLDVLEQSLRRRVYAGVAPDWLQRPGRLECGPRWQLIQHIYRRLTDGMRLPANMPGRERRSLDGLVGGRGMPKRFIEVDESQHFNVFRTLTLQLYPRDEPLGFPRLVWMEAGADRIPTHGGGWGKPKPPLFPMPGGRHRQRAFRDATADLLPPLYGYAPTLRIADFEVEPWIWNRGASARLRTLLEERLG